MEILRESYEKGTRNFCVKFDDTGLDLDKESGTDKLFQKNYAKAIIHYLKELGRSLKAIDPQNTLYWLPQTYWNGHFEFMSFSSELLSVGGVPGGVGLCWTGSKVVSETITVDDVREFLDRYGWKEGSPRGVIYDNFGRARESYALTEAQ